MCLEGIEDDKQGYGIPPTIFRSTCYHGVADRSPLWGAEGLLADLQTLTKDLQIFQHLHPIDLYSLIRTNKVLRALLLSKESYSTWRNSYFQHSDIPWCPPDTSHPRWTTILFGPDKCHVCTYFSLLSSSLTFCHRNVEVTMPCPILLFEPTIVNPVLWVLFSNHYFQSLLVSDAKLHGQSNVSPTAGMSPGPQGFHMASPSVQLSMV